MTDKTFDQLWDELVPGSGEADTVQGEMVRCIGRLYSEHLRNGYMNYMSNKHEFNSELIERLITDHSIIDQMFSDDDEDRYLERELNEILSSGLFDMEDEKLLELKKSYDECSSFDEEVNFLKRMLPDHAALIENLRIDVPFGALSHESADVMRKLYIDSLDIIPNDYKESEELLRSLQEKHGHNRFGLFFGIKTRYDIEVADLIDKNQNIVPLIEKLKPLIAKAPFTIGLAEPDLDRDLEAVEKVVVEYCNSHPELIVLREVNYYPHA